MAHCSGPDKVLAAVPCSHAVLAVHAAVPTPCTCVGLGRPVAHSCTLAFARKAHDKNQSHVGEQRHAGTAIHFVLDLLLVVTCVQVMDSEALSSLMDRQLGEVTGSDTGSDGSGDGCSPPVYSSRYEAGPGYGSGSGSGSGDSGDSGDDSDFSGDDSDDGDYVPSILPLGYCYCE